MLQTRRDWNSALEAKGWFIAFLKITNSSESSSLYDEDVEGKTSNSLANRIIAGFPPKSIAFHYTAASGNSKKKKLGTAQDFQKHIEAGHFQEVENIQIEMFKNSIDEKEKEHLALCILSS